MTIGTPCNLARFTYSSGPFSIQLRLSLDALEQQLRPDFIASLSGDAAAYRRFLDGISARLRSTLRHMLARHGRHDPGEVEDVLQEILLGLHLSRHTYDPSVPVTAWAHAIARYKLVDHLRRSGRHAGLDPLDEAIVIAGPDTASAAEARLDIGFALQSLPDRTRGLIDKVRLQGASVAEAAAAAGMTETAAKVAIHRGMRALAAILKKQRP